ncbi:MAG: phosphoglycerate dehydrogenase [Phycisphaeraceae bacterium]|nr:phosphoglycerate dehydrogenase [Phycisphaeraceae bacterium]MBX3366677.1 phosphoglycerate dehydrogenase [Phycisphaeraceae bacterium]
MVPSPTTSSPSPTALESGATQSTPLPTSFPKDRIKILLLEGVHPRGADILRAEGFHVECHAKALEGDALLKAASDAHVIGIRSKTTITPEVLAAAPRLLTIGCFCIGTNQVGTREACDRGIPVFNSPFSNTRSVAELTIAEVISLNRSLVDKSVGLHRGDWDKSATGAHEIRGRTLGIVGYGHIGSQVSVLAEAMGMRVLFYDIAPKQALGNAKQVRTLGELLAESDTVTLHVPATSSTDNLIGRGQIAQMRPGAFLINNARGTVVDLDALADGLRSGRIAGAALDVFPVEPAGKGDAFVSPVQGLKNVILTPHIGGSTEEAQESIAVDVVGKLARFVNNGSTTGAVNVPEVDLPEQVRTDGQIEHRTHRILHFHRNVPGVLGHINAITAELGVNVNAQYLRTNEQIGYVVLDVDPSDAPSLDDRLRTVPDTIRVRALW